MKNSLTAFSICIPIYNYDVSILVKELYKQSLETHLPFEILLMDDRSSILQKENRLLGELPFVTYMELKENIGRAKIRNRLAQAAQYPYLIFMDCDTETNQPDYIRKYLNILPADIVAGGYAYSLVPPEKEYLLRWHYGRNREEIPAAVRNQHPNKSFSTFNFMIRKDLFEQVRFDETISGYGHEDTLFGWALRQEGVTIKHIDNSLLHKSLDDSATFISKIENSVKNLWHIYQLIPEKKEFSQDNKLLRCYLIFKKYHLTFLISIFSFVARPILLCNLKSKHPKMLCMDLFKLVELNRSSSV